MAKLLKQSSRASVEVSLRAAFAGKAPWLEALVVKAGWVRPGHVRTRAAVAAFFGVTTKTIGEWLASGCPGRDPAGYHLAAILRWRDAQAEERRRAGSNGNGDARQMLYRYQAELARLKVQQARGDVVTRETLERECHARSDYLVRTLRSIGAIAATRCKKSDRHEVRRIVIEVAEEMIGRAYGYESEDDDSNGGGHQGFANASARERRPPGDSRSHHSKAESRGTNTRKKGALAGAAQTGGAAEEG